MEAEKSFAERLANENEGMVEWEERLVRTNGYDVNGKVISREAVTDSTISGAIRKKQTVHRYEDFRTGGPVLTVNLTNLEGVDADVIMMLIQQANRELSAWGDKIFGRMDEATHSVKQLRIPRDMGQAGAAEYAAVGDKAEDTKIYSKLLAKKYEDGKLSVEEEAELERVMEGSTGIRDGELGAHIGFAPKFKEGGSLDLEKSRSSNVEYAGAGEMGLIMLDFQWNAMMNSKGYTELAKPMYDQKMWAGDMLGMEPPTLRTVTAIAAEIAGKFLPGLEYVDDLLFAGLDVTQGYKSVGEVATNLVVTAATAVASVGINFGFDKLGGILNGTFGSGMGQVALNAGLAGAKTLTTSTINSAVNAVQWDGSGLTWNRDVFDAGFKAGLVSSAVSMTGAFASGALGQLNLGAKLEKVLGFNEGQIGEMQKFNSFVGNLTGAGVNYAMTGEATLNVLNLSDLTGGKLNLGLLELHLGGEKGVSMSIGSGGTDISLGTIAGAMAGLSHWGKNIEIEGAAKRNEMANVATGLRGLYGFGDETDKAELESILSGKTKLIAGGAGTGAQTETVNGQRYITLNGVNEADTAEKKLELALVLSHEGRRDGVTDENNKAETRSAVWAHTEMAVRMLGDKATSSVMMGAINGDENLRSDLGAYMTAKMKGDDSLFDKYVDGAYDSSADFWKLTKDGNGNWKWVDDKSADFDISEALNDPEFKKNLDRFLGTGSGNLREALSLSQYKDGKKEGVISAERMNETTAYSLATMLVPFDFTPTRTIGGLEYKSDYRLQSDMNRRLFIKNTLENIQYNEYHTTTIRNDKNQPVTLWNIDSTNATRIDLLSQNDDIFSDIKGIASGGCNFMVILAAAQIMTGETLSAGQIKDIWKNAVASNPAILSSDGTVEIRNALANMALSQLGRTDIAISMDGTFNSADAIKPDRALMGNRIGVPYQATVPSHYILGAKSSTALTVPVYNPGNTGRDDKLFQSGAEIWAYAKKTR